MAHTAESCVHKSFDMLKTIHHVNAAVPIIAEVYLFIDFFFFFFIISGSFYLSVSLVPDYLADFKYLSRDKRTNRERTQLNRVN